jgi:hypothetical protein
MDPTEIGCEKTAADDQAVKSDEPLGSIRTYTCMTDWINIRFNISVLRIEINT